MIKIYPYLHPSLITFLEAQTRDGILHEMTSLLFKNGKIPEEESFYQAILEREKIVSTGIGMGVALPHAKLANCTDFLVALGLLKQGVRWHDSDGTPVRIVFMIGGPEAKQTEYLQLLSALTLSIKDEERRRALLAETNIEKILDLFKAY